VFESDERVRDLQKELEASRAHAQGLSLDHQSEKQNLAEELNAKGLTHDQIVAKVKNEISGLEEKLRNLQKASNDWKAKNLAEQKLINEDYIYRLQQAQSDYDALLAVSNGKDSTLAKSE
jgi:tRNA(Ile)-lysidine synthase TilS/MesJ